MAYRALLLLLTTLVLTCQLDLAQAEARRARVRKGHYPMPEEPRMKANLTEVQRQGKLFSLFNIVTFKNTDCTTASDSTMKGTCLSSTECNDAGGSMDGNCASGFGVCCVFTQNSCGGSVSRNCTYLQNAEYPSTASASTTCSYTFNRICPNLCQIRLDFDNLVTAQPPSVGTNTVGDCATSGDLLTVTSPTGKSPPVVCGTLSGQHMFLETGSTGTAGTAAFTFGTSTDTKTYKIKVTYYQCDSTSKAPADCVQYFTGVSNTVTSYNYPNLILDGQNYMSCFRQEQGYCSIDYNQTPSTGTDTFDFFLSNTQTSGQTNSETNDCQLTYITIPNTASATAGSASIFCGGALSVQDATTISSTVTSVVGPFEFSTFTLNGGLGDNSAPENPIGYSIDYTQQPC